jgi:hypothetical protein
MQLTHITHQSEMFSPHISLIKTKNSFQHSDKPSWSLHSFQCTQLRTQLCDPRWWENEWKGRQKKRVYCKTEWTWCGILFEEIHCNNKYQNTMVHSTVSRSVNVFSPATNTKRIHRKRRHILKFLQKMKPLALNCTSFYTHAVLSKQVAFSASCRLYNLGIEYPLGWDFSKTHPDRPWGSTSLP